MGYLFVLVHTVLSGLWLGWAVDDLLKKKYTYFGIEAAMAVTSMGFAIRTMFTSL